MGITVTATSDAAAALAEARAFLTSRPAEHNVVLTLLSHAAPELPDLVGTGSPRDGDRVVGVVFLSPLDFTPRSRLAATRSSTRSSARSATMCRT